MQHDIANLIIWVANIPHGVVNDFENRSPFACRLREKQGVEVIDRCGNQAGFGHDAEGRVLGSEAPPILPATVPLLGGDRPLCAEQ